MHTDKSQKIRVHPRSSVVPLPSSQDFELPQLKNQMIGEFRQVASAPRRVERMKFRRSLLDSPNRRFEFREESITSRIRPLVVVVEDFVEVSPDQWVEDQLHLARDARIPFIKSRSAIPCTTPDRSSSPRRTASVRLSSSKSLGSAPSRLSRISAARSARSPTPNFSASAPISVALMGGLYHDGAGLQAASSQHISLLDF